MSHVVVILALVGTMLQGELRNSSDAQIDAYGDPLPEGARMRLGGVRSRGDGFSVSADGKWIATSQAHYVQLRDAATGREVRRFVCRSHRVDAFALSPDAKLLAMAENDSVVIWNAETAVRIRILSSACREGSRLLFSPDGSHLAVDIGHSTELWELSTGRLLWKLGAPMAHMEVLPIAFDPGGKTLTTDAEDNAIVVRDSLTGAEIRRLTKSAERYCHAAASRVAMIAAVSKNDGSIGIWKTSDAKEVGRLNIGVPGVRTIALSTDGTQLALFSALDRTLQLWSVTTGKKVGQIPIPGYLLPHLEFLRNNSELAYVMWPERYIRRIAVPSLRPIDTDKATRCQVQAIAYSPDGATLASGGTDDIIRIWDTRSGKEIRQFIARQSYVSSLAFSPDSTRLLSAGYKSPELCLWDPATGNEIRRWRAHDSPVHRVCFSPDGKQFASICMPMQDQHTKRAIKVWDLPSGRELFRFDRYATYSDDYAAFSPDSRTLFIADGPMTRAWDTESGKDRTEISDCFTTARFLAMSPNGKSVIAAAARPGDGPGRKAASAIIPPFALWEVRTGKERLRFERLPAGSLIRYFFSPDGCILAAGGYGQTSIYLWNAHSGKLLGTLDGHDSWIMDLAFSPDGRSLASASYDTTVLIWDIARHRPRDQEAELAEGEGEKCWSEMAGDDAMVAYTAIHKLAKSPKQSIDICKARLQPAAGADAKVIAKHIEDLDSSSFADREKATRALESLGELAETELEQALQKTSSLEVRRRAEALLKKARGPNRLPNTLRALRAVEVLEQIATPDARAVLETLASGTPAAQLTRDCRDASARLTRRSAATSR